MQSVIFLVIITLSFVSSVISGRINELSAAVLEGGRQAVEMILFMFSSLCIWNGVLNILKESGGVKLFAKILSPAVRLIFPCNIKNDDFKDNAIMNITSNLLGISNAATPAGLRAVSAMRSANGNKITREMASFVLINTASIQLVPTSSCMLRQKFGCTDAYNILPAVWLTSILSLAVGLTSVYLLYPEKRKSRKKI